MTSANVIRTQATSPNTNMDTDLSYDRSYYRYWRIRIMYATIIGYAAYYLVRQNFSLAMPGICEEFGYTKTELGLIVTIASIVYGIGKFLNGYFSDRSNARYFMTVGLIGSAFVNLTMGLGSGFAFFAFLWAVNGWFQSMGWPPSARMITHWFSPKELGFKWSLWASSHQIGAATISLIGGWLIVHYGWRSVFYVPAVMALLAALFILDRLRDTPKKVGLPPVEHYKGDTENFEDSEARITSKEIWSVVLRNKYVWYMGVANMCLYIPRMGIFFWAPTFLKEFKSVTIVVAGMQLAAFEIAGLFGGVIAGILSDKVFHGRRGPVGMIFLIFLGVFLGLVWLVPPGHPMLDAFLLMMAGFMVYGPQVLAGVAVADFTSKRAIGVATGVIGVLGSFGTAVSGIGIGYIVDHYGWDNGFLLFICAALLGSVFFALTIKRR
jgi:phosphoglycerate transporter family protein